MSRRRAPRGLSRPLVFVAGFLLALALTRWALLLELAAGAVIFIAAYSVRPARPRGMRRTPPRPRRAAVATARPAGTEAGHARPAVPPRPAGPLPARVAERAAQGRAKVVKAAQAYEDSPDPRAALRATLAARADRVSTRIPPPAPGPERPA